MDGVMLVGCGVKQLGEDGVLEGVMGPSDGQSRGLYLMLSRTLVLKWACYVFWVNVIYGVILYVLYIIIYIYLPLRRYVYIENSYQI